MVQKLLRQARKGTRLVYVPGNHDEFLRNYFGTHFGGIEVVADAVHVAADGKRYLVTHGDRFDLVVKHARWLALFGDQASVLAITINKMTNWFRRRFGLGHWSLSGWAKLKVKNAVNYIGDFEQALAAQARRHRCDGVICGHIHHPAIRDIGGVHYVNCGDWVESCTVVVENAERRDRNPVDQVAGEPRTRRREGASGLMRILIATDAWRPQVNGVLHTLEAKAQAAEALGAEVVFLNPEGFRASGMPSYPGIRLALPRPREIFRRIADIRPDAIHIATEGPIGHFVRCHCVDQPAPVHDELPYPFHRLCRRTLAGPATAGPGPGCAGSTMPAAAPWCRPPRSRRAAQAGFPLRAAVAARGRFARCSIRRHGRDLGLPRPMFLAVGRLAVEKNVDAFLALDLPGTKVVVGDGPARTSWRAAFRTPSSSAPSAAPSSPPIYAAADVFVFPSRTDTFGLVLLEALASGLPIAGFPVAATQRRGRRRCRSPCSTRICATLALARSRFPARPAGNTPRPSTWEESARSFLGNLVSARNFASEPSPVGKATPRLLDRTLRSGTLRSPAGE